MIPKVEMWTDKGDGDVLQAGDGDNMFLSVNNLKDSNSLSQT